jgi:hypothetical protein
MALFVLQYNDVDALGTYARVNHVAKVAVLQRDDLICAGPM